MQLPSPTDDLASAARQVLSEVFGYTAFRGQQAEIVEQVGGGDALEEAGVHAAFLNSSLARAQASPSQ